MCVIFYVCTILGIGKSTKMSNSSRPNCQNFWRSFPEHLIFMSICILRGAQIFSRNKGIEERDTILGKGRSPWRVTKAQRGQNAIFWQNEVRSLPWVCKQKMDSQGSEILFWTFIDIFPFGDFNKMTLKRADLGQD